MSKGLVTKVSYSIALLALALAPLFLSDFRLGLLTKFLALAILAIGLDLIWGYTGILSLGHGVFFGLGAYAMAMYMKMEASGGQLPDFMSWSGLEKLPWFWEPFKSPFFAIPAGIIIPMLVAFILGIFTFRNRIRGVYFTILTQALVIIAVTLFIGQQQYTGGTNGITDFTTIFGLPYQAESTKIGLYFVTLVMVVLVILFSKWLINTRAGKVLRALNDAENRARFIGYDPSKYQLFIFCVSAGLAGLAGMLFVLQVGIISPTMMGIVPSVEIVLWVALGGRGSIIGAAIGAVVVNAAKSGFSEAYPDGWLYFIGALFIIVVVFMPKGLVGLSQSIRAKFKGSVKDNEKESSNSVLREGHGSI